MPWHRIRVCAQHGARRRQRTAYWLNVSILAAALVVVLAWLGVINTFVGEFTTARPVSGGIRAALTDSTLPPFFSVSPGLCAAITAAGLVWLFVATTLKPGN
jgi:hypothetical protein